MTLKGNDIQKAKTLRYRRPCPIDGGCPTRMFKTSYVTMCLSNQKRAGTRGFLAFFEGTPRCHDCERGKRIKNGERWAKPKTITWLK